MVSPEILDLATIKPIDEESILTSVRKTGRLLVVHEACQTAGVGAEIISLVTSQLFYSLKSPPQRLAGFDTVMPYYKNEHYYLLDTDMIVTAVQSSWRSFNETF